MGKAKKTLSKKEKDDLKNEMAKERETAAADQKNVPRQTQLKEGELIDKNDPLYKDESVLVKIEGRIKVGKIPRYRQRGEIVRLKASSQYLGINILRAEKIQAPESRATINTYITIEWGGQVKKTSIQYDNYGPSFNEEFYFEIPVKKKTEFRKSLIQELSTNNTVSLDLWLEGEDGTSDNLGNTVFTVAEVADGSLEERIILDMETKKTIKFLTRVVEVKKSLKSGFFQGVSGQVLIQMFLLPGIKEDEINLRDFVNIREDKYPVELEFERNRDMYRDQWDTKLNTNFVRMPLEGNRLKNIKTLMVNDQYSNPHFLSMFISKYTLDTYETDTDNIDPEDLKLRKLETLAELAHFIRSIPFKTESRSNEVWNTPNFISIMKKADIQDHALLLVKI